MTLSWLALAILQVKRCGCDCGRNEQETATGKRALISVALVVELERAKEEAK